jgi:hypothetical protein
MEKAEQFELGRTTMKQSIIWELLGLIIWIMARRLNKQH